MSQTKVKDWLGITEEEFSKKVHAGTCVKCGKDAVSCHSNLCWGDLRAYRRWRNKIEQGEVARVETGGGKK